MKIPQGTSVTSSTAAQAAEAGRAKGTSGKTAATPKSEGAVQLSPLSTRLSELASSLSGPEFDRAKVDQIKQAISDGKLTINIDRVADRMIQDVKDRIALGIK